MKKATKILSLLLALAMVLSLAACGGKAPEATGSTQASGSAQPAAAAQTTIEWWTPNWDEAASREFVEEFEAENPDIHVELVITDCIVSKPCTAILFFWYNCCAMRPEMLSSSTPYI